MDFKGYIKGFFLLLLLLIISVPMAGKYRKLRLLDDHSFSGTAIGTNFSIIVSHTPLANRDFEVWKREITALMDQLDKSMSNYISESEVTRLNHIQDTNFHPVSADLHTVISASLDAYRETDGYFDITVSPLVDLWGFGPVPPGAAVPSEQDVKGIMSRIGSDKIKIDASQGFKKLDHRVNINLNAISKGFLVDKVAQYLLDKGCNNFMVEIGGEIAVKGNNRNGVPWRIGVETPNYNSKETVYGVVPMNSGGMATSGDYRRYIKEDGKVYSHIIDPKTGYPAKHALASVTVIAENSMKADAYATALFVMGMEKGLKWVEKREGVEAYFIERTADGVFISKGSSGFKIEPMTATSK